MSDDISRTSDKNTAGLMAVLLLLPLVYLLSIGPMGFLLEKFHVPMSMRSYVLAFYRPVIWLHNNTPLKQPLEAYARWWSDLAGH
ncbi:MAG: hypothetical protein B7Z47_05205 [Chthoniobacter sp. 12-60-6]|nr:MAG: hypothetical protein B7Z47_05205 [Chthoniobacter sp. 12-60-6]